MSSKAAVRLSQHSGVLKRRLISTAGAVALLALASGKAGAAGQTYNWFYGDYLDSGLPSRLLGDDTLNIRGRSDLVMKGVTLDNQGVVNWRRSDILLDGSTINNSGLWNSTSGSKLRDVYGKRSVFNNTGVFSADSANNWLTQISVDFVNSGVVNAQSGLLALAGTSKRFLDGSRFTGAGSVGVFGDSSFSGQIHSANLFISSGTSTGDHAVLHGTSVLSDDGTLTGTWALAPDHHLTVRSQGATYLSEATLTNQGSVTIAGPGALRLDTSVIVNQGSFELQGDSSIRYGGGMRKSQFDNRGLLVKSDGTGVSDLSQLYVSNSGSGTIDVRSGTLRLPDIFDNWGVLQGTGKFVSNDISNLGNVRVGEDGLGTLTIEGSLTSYGALDVGLGNAGQHGLLSIEGDLTALGELSLSCVGKCSFAAGDHIEVLHYTGTRRGTFESLSLHGFGTGAFTTLYDDANHRIALLVTQAVTAVVPEPATWLLWCGALGFAGLGARRRRQ